MDSSSLDINNFKMQLKARLRVPLFMKSKHINDKFNENFKSSPSNDITLLSYIQSKIKMNNSYMDSFNQYSLKTDVLKSVLLNMSIKEILEEEKVCSKRCKDVINEIDTKKHRIESINLPKIKTDYKNNKKKIIIKKLQIKPQPSKRIIFKKNYMKLDYQNTPYLSSTNRMNSDLESTREKEKMIFKSRSKKEITPKCLFNYKKNYSIIKGGGIRYDNSIFRFKNMNDLIHFRL